ncbi:signal transduction histidine kinase [Paracoccus acridae]|uniref:histidine kinase n=1 Tax=Paracoccus acridae TaxID=1795310 RepID=A0ABQ1VJM7_9RHOB|nr:response regulator [Paracoccus acridae]GGF72928.1 signal transduction histidine kinase [Paracoccus acridae]
MAKTRDLAILSLIVVLICAVFIFDLYVRLGTAVWLIYIIPLALSFSTTLPWAPVAVAVMSCVAMAAGFFLDGQAGIDPRIAAVNRTMAGIVYLILGNMGRMLIGSREAMHREAWIREGEGEVSQAVQGDPSARQLGQDVLRVLADRLGARAAVAYAVDGQGVERLAAWGVDEGDPAGKVRGTPGHLARAIAEGRPVHLTLDPDQALGWGSGLARGRAAHALIVPTREGRQTDGVLEFGFDAPPPGRAMDLLDRVGERVALALRSVAYRQRLQDLLEETRHQAEELRSHAEELAATNEELEEQSRALQDSQRRLEEQQAELEQQNSQLEIQTQELEDQRDALARSRRSLEAKTIELARESRYKSEFVANMSHELRTPLNALLIMSRLLAENRSRTLTEEQVRWAETIESSGKDLLVLINDILDLSKIEAGKMEVARESVDPGQVARKLVRAFEEQARTKGLELGFELAPGLRTIQTDPARLEQVLRNFLSNALKFTERGRVTLRIAPAPDGIAFAVADTGIGIDPDQQDAVFEAFRQADGTISRRFGGTGLGLSISRELADLLGGRIVLESRKGQGSTFTLVLPDMADKAAPAPAPVAASGPAPDVAGAGEGEEDNTPLAALPGLTDDRDRIEPGDRVMLVVEDDAAFAGLLCDLARELGFRCVCVDRADDAVRAARRFLPHAIVLDIRLPDHSGLSALDRLKRDTATRHIPVHVISAEDYTREAMAQGAISYMLKPVAREQLETAIRNLEQRLKGRLRRVLIVEDDPAQMEGLRALLASDEVETVGAGTAAQAFEICRSQTVDCIVLDMTLPDASGFDLLERLDGDGTASFPPVIVYTARALDEAEEQRLRRYSKSIIIKGAKSPERLVNEVTLFLHQVVSELPERQRKMLAASLNRDAQLDGRRILVVEDDIRNIYALTGVFEPHGATVQIARNGREALEALGRINDGAAPKVDLVLMDVMMPEMDGLTATREIRKIDRWKTLPIIMLTAKAMAEDQNRCIEAGANDYLSKPLDVDKLLSLTRVWMPR